MERSRRPRADPDEPVLGRNLAETLALNRPEARADRRSREALRRAAPDEPARARARRRLVRVLLYGMVAIALVGLLASLIERLGS